MMGKQTFIFNYVRLFLFWISFYVFGKTLFLIYNLKDAHTLSISDKIWAMMYGLKLDASASGYILALPVVIGFIHIWIQGDWYKTFLNIYSILLLVINTCLITIDMKLYTYWGYKLDITPLSYLKNPSEVFASLTFTDMLVPLITGLAHFMLFKWIFSKYIIALWPQFYASKLKNSMYAILICIGTFVAIRGGFSIKPFRLGIPINLGAVYFHPQNIANHTAINVFWNVLFSYIEKDQLTQKSSFMDSRRCDAIMDSLHLNHADSVIKVLNTPNPNILLLVLESFTSKGIGALGGDSTITPQLNNWAKKGLLFTNFYASGDRSDKGLVAIMSGYPAQPTSSIINYMPKIQKLPYISKSLKKKGYETAFYYGGEIDFANFRGYFYTGQTDKIVSKTDFPIRTYTTKWGVHDEHVFNKLQEDLLTQNAPFFYSMFSLSSHEPFDVPSPITIPGMDDESRFKNALHYTDACLGTFLNKAKNSKWWKNTLVIIVADHGVRYINNSENSAPDKYKIPMLWTGGAISSSFTGKKIEKIGSQTDIAATLLTQLQLPHNEYLYSKNLLKPSTRGFAYYAFNNGFGFVTDSTIQVYNNDSHSHSYLEGMNEKSPKTQLGKAYLQSVSADFVKK